MAKPETDAEQREPLAGLVERVTYHNADTGFAVLRVKVRGHRDLVTVLGSAAEVHAGEHIEASGRWERHRDHGMQFRALFLQVTPPSSLEGIERYLGSGMIKGIGPKYAKRLVATFGEQVFDVIEASPERLLEVEGIGKVRLARITKGWGEQKAIRAIMSARPRHRHVAGRAYLQDLRCRRHPAGERKPLPARARHSRHRVQDRRRAGHQARYSQGLHAARPCHPAPTIARHVTGVTRAPAVPAKACHLSLWPGCPVTREPSDMKERLHPSMPCPRQHHVSVPMIRECLRLHPVVC